MKKTAIILGTSFASITLIGSLFKVMHWPGANICLVLGMAGLALIALPMLAINQLKKA